MELKGPVWYFGCPLVPSSKKVFGRKSDQRTLLDPHGSLNKEKEKCLKMAGNHDSLLEIPYVL